MKAFRIALPLVVAVSLAACQSSNMGNKELGGTVVGAALGGLVGSQFGSGGGQLAATALGVALGAYLGNQIGASLDRADQAYAQQAAQHAITAPTGTTSSWQNQKTGHSGTYTPTSGVYTDSQGRQCRNMKQTITLENGKTETVTVKGCQNKDGSWEFSS